MNTVRRESSEIEVCAYSAGGPGLHSRRNQDPPGPLVYICSSRNASSLSAGWALMQRRRVLVRVCRSPTAGGANCSDRRRPVWTNRISGDRRRPRRWRWPARMTDRNDAGRANCCGVGESLYAQLASSPQLHSRSLWTPAYLSDLALSHCTHRL
jgi:hypothetical protein